MIQYNTKIKLFCLWFMRVHYNLQIIILVFEGTIPFIVIRGWK